MLLKKTILLINPYLNKIYDHPFQQGLRDGSLPIEIFKEFIIQDDLYLQALSNTLDIIANREDNFANKIKLEYLARYIHNVERNIHLKYGIPNKNNSKPYFFRQKLKKHQTCTTVAAYIEHLTYNAHYSNIAIAIASVAPCFYIYHHLGQIPCQLSANNIYKNWLNSYASITFKDATNKIIDLYQDYGAQHTDLQLLMQQTFLESTKHELKFLESLFCSNKNLFNLL
jgi:thiaminase/transcriptional activator TenA